MQELFFLNERLRGYDAVIIYGAGFSGTGILYKLLQHNVKVYCFADSDPEKCGKRIMNIPVLHIDELGDYRDAAVIVGGLYAFTVAAELEKRGFCNLFFDYANEVRALHLDCGDG